MFETVHLENVERPEPVGSLGEVLEMLERMRTVGFVDFGRFEMLQRTVDVVKIVRRNPRFGCLLTVVVCCFEPRVGQQFVIQTKGIGRSKRLWPLGGRFVLLVVQSQTGMGASTS
jgi:hypothetical protein